MAKKGVNHRYLIHQCRACLEKLSFRKYLVHVETCQGQGKDTKHWPCGMCKENFDLKGGLRGHIRKHKNLEQFRCLECPEKSFYRKNDYDHHLRMHVGELFKCPTCENGFVTLSGLTRHQKTTIACNDRPCMECKKSDDPINTMFCDGCYNPYHTTCAGLEKVPRRKWVCMPCDESFITKLDSLLRETFKEDWTEDDELPNLPLLSGGQLAVRVLECLLKLGQEWVCVPCDKSFSTKLHSLLRETFKEDWTEHDELLILPLLNGGQLAVGLLLECLQELEQEDRGEIQGLVRESRPGRIVSDHDSDGRITADDYAPSEDKQPGLECQKSNSTTQILLYNRRTIEAGLDDDFPARKDCSNEFSGRKVLNNQNGPVSNPEGNTGANMTDSTHATVAQMMKVSNVDKTKGGFHCGERDCNKSYKTVGLLKRHEKNHSQGIPCTIKGCDRMFARRELLNRHLKTHATERNIRRKEIWKDFEFRNRAPDDVNVNISPQGHVISEHPTISTRLPKERMDDVSSHDKANNPSAEDDQLYCARGISDYLDPDPDLLRYTIVCDSCSKSYHVIYAGLEEMPDTRICEPCNASMSYEAASLLDRIKVDKGVVDRVRETPQFAAALFYFSRNLREKEQSEFHDPSGTLTTQECPSIIAIDEQSPHICEPMSEILPAALGSTWDGGKRESWSGGVAIGHGNNTSSNPNLVDTSGCSPLFPDTEFLPRQVPNCDWTSSPEALSTEGQLDKPIDNITNGINSKPFLGGESTSYNRFLPGQPYHRKFHVQNSSQVTRRMLKENSLYHDVTPEADGLYHCPYEFDPTAGCEHKPVSQKSYYHRFMDSHFKQFDCTYKACRSEGFGSQGRLRWHDYKEHAMHRDSERLCTVDGCERSKSGKGFVQASSLWVHQKRNHETC